MKTKILIYALLCILTTVSSAWCKEEKKYFIPTFPEIELLAKEGGKEAVISLLKYRAILEDERKWTPDSYYTGLELYVVGALYKLGNKEYIDFIYQAAQSRDDSIRAYAGGALGMVKNRKSRDILFRLLHEESELTSCVAADALLKQRDRDTLNNLCRMIKKDKRVRSECLSDIGKIAAEMGIKKGGPCDKIEKYFEDPDE